jgi:RND family efflux transporter MFP subunit
MRHSEPEQPGSPIGVAVTDEERLRRENDELRRQLVEARGESHGDMPAQLWRPSGVAITAILLGLTVLILVAFFAGYLPRQRRMNQITQEALEQDRSVPRVEVIRVERAPSEGGLQLPASIQPVAEAPVLARADGYLGRRLADIGDRVKAGQSLAEIDAPELDAQVRQSKANVEQTRASMEQALASLEQGKSDLELARLTSERWASLSTQGIVSRQDNDQYQAQYRSKLAAVQALDKAIAVQRSGIAVAEANVSRLERMQSYRVVRAPFDGIITLRNVEVGALVNAGSTLLFRIAQTGTLRAYVSVPQTHAGSVRPGQPARLTVSNLPGRVFNGTVARSAGALDPSSRTMLVEVNVPNADNALLPGMYAQVELGSARSSAPIVIPSDALIVRADGAQVAVVAPDRTLHLRKISVGRDYGSRLEVTGGLEEGETIVSSPGDVALEGTPVDPVPAAVSGSSPARAAR